MELPKMIKWILLFLFIPLFLMGQKVYELTLDNAIKLAVKNNPSFKMTYEKIKDARLSQRQSWGAMLPKVDVRSSNIVDEKVRVIEMPDFLDPTKTRRIKLDFTYDYQVDYSVTQPVFSGGKIFRGIQMSNANAKITELEKSLNETDLAFNVVRAYLSILVAQEFLKVATDSYEIARDFYETTQKRYNQGTVSKLDLLQAEVQMSNLLPRKTQAENGLKIAEAGLRLYLGMDGDVTLVLMDELGYRPHDYSSEQLIKEALNNRLELEQMDLRKRMGKLSLSIARGDYLPMMMLTGLYSTFGNDPENHGNWDDSYSIALGLNFNLFNGGQTHFNIQKSKIAIRQAEWSRQAFEDAIQLEVEQAYLTLLESERTLLSQEKTVAQAEEAARLAQIQYREGTITNLQANQIQMNLTSARANYIQALFNYTLSDVAIKKSVGKSLVAEIEKDNR